MPRGQVNLSVARRRCGLRYCDYDEPDHPATPVADVRIERKTQTPKGAAAAGYAHRLTGDGPGRLVAWS